MTRPNREKKPPRGRPAIPPAEREKTRQRISDIARQLFRGEGFSKVSMRKIAKAMGVTPMTLYQYYPAKIDILKSLWSAVFDAVFETMPGPSREQTPEDRLLGLSCAYMAYWIARPDDYRLVFMAEGVMQPDVSLFLDTPKLTEHFTVFLGVIAALNEGADDAELKPKLDFFIAAMHGIIHNAVTISGYDWAPPETQIAYAISGISRSHS